VQRLQKFIILLISTLLCLLSISHLLYGSPLSELTPQVDITELSHLKPTGMYLKVFYSSGRELEIPVEQFTNYAVSLIAVGNNATIFINDLRSGDKVDILLRNLTLLSEQRYLSNGRIRVIILPGLQLSKSHYVIPRGTLEIKSIKGKIYEQITLMNGTLIGESHALPFVFAEIQYESVFKLAENENIARIFLDKRYHVRLNESVPIIKPPREWENVVRYFGYSINGSGVKIAILDTGIDKHHPDLDDLDDNPATNDSKVIAEESFTNEDHTWDGFGHGTHCASIAAGTGQASSYKFIGVAPGAYLLNGKVLTDAGWGYESWIISGVEWAVNKGAHVISMSLGSDVNGDGTDPLSMAIDWATDQGVVVVVAAGNAGLGGMFTVGIPGVARKAITVCATTKTDVVADFSSQGLTADLRLKPDVCAPGVSIIAARANGTSMGTPIDNYYTMASGTSMATPHVAGAAALIIQAHPDWGPIMVKSALMGYAKSLSNERLWRQGAGRINVCKSIMAKLLILEPSASFGILGLGDSVSKIITVMNVANFTVTVNISLATFAEGESVEYVNANSTSLTIPAHSNASIALQAGPLDENAPEGYYEGFLNASAINDTVKFPYVFAALSTLTTYLFDIDDRTSINAPILIASYPDLKPITFSPAGLEAKFYLKSGNYSILTQSAWIEVVTSSGLSYDFNRAFMLQKVISIPKLSRLNVSIKLSEARTSFIPTIDYLGNNLTIHAYTQYFSGGPQSCNEYFCSSTWSIGGMWSGLDLNTSKITFYSTSFDPPDMLCEALGFYASDNLLSEVYLMPFKFWNTSNLPSTISYLEQDLAKYYVFYDVPETYPENGLNIMNAFWFTWDHLGFLQVWIWDVHSTYAGINATYYLAPEVATYWGYYMPTYKGWLIPLDGPSQEWSIGRHYPYPQIPLGKGETGSIILGRFSFGPYQPGLSLNISRLSEGFLVSLSGDIWKNLSWPHMQWYMLSPQSGPISPYPHYYATYRLYVDQVLLDHGILNGTEGFNGEPYVHVPPYLNVDWKSVYKEWNILGGRVTLIVDMPSLAYLSANSSLTMDFLLGQSDSTPPTIRSISYPLKYGVSERMRIHVDAEDQGLGVKEISLYYSFDNSNWFKASQVGSGIFELSTQPKDSVSVRIIVKDYAGNTLEYRTSPLAICSDLTMNVEEGLANPGQILHGNLTTVEGEPLTGFAVLISSKHYSNYVQSINFSYKASRNIGESITYIVHFHGSNIFSNASRQAVITSTALDVDVVIPSSTFTNTGDAIVLYIHMAYAHNGSPIPLGLACLEGVECAETNSTGWAEVCVARNYPGIYWFKVVGFRDSTGRITYSRTSQNVTITWTHVILDGVYVSDSRADVGSLQYIALHASWSHNASSVVGGTIYVNGTPYVTNATGWASFNATSHVVGRELWSITGVSCMGIIKYEKAVADPYIIWDKVVFNISALDSRIDVGRTASISVLGYYAYDRAPFKGIYVFNDTLTKHAVGKYGYKISFIKDSEYNLTVFECNEVSVVFDRVIIDVFTVKDNRINIGEQASFIVSGYYEYDGVPWSGGYSLNDTAVKNAVGRYVYRLASITDERYGLTAFLQKAPDVYVVFDRVNVILMLSDNRIDVGSKMLWSYAATYEYDGSDATPYVIVTLNDTDTKNSVGKWIFTVKSITESQYGLTTFTSNAIDCIWDVVIITLRVFDERISIGSSASYSFTAIYAYDSSNATPYVIVNLNDTLTKSNVGKYCYVAASIIESQYGISTFESNSVCIIYDTVIVIESGVSDELVEVGGSVTVWFKAVYAYDGSPFSNTQGTLCINDEQAKWSSIYERWEYTHGERVVSEVSFKVTQIYDEFYNPFVFEDCVGSRVVKWVYLKPLYEAPIIGQAVSWLNRLSPGYGSITFIAIIAVVPTAILILVKRMTKRKL